jgi:hypothetical protein
LILGVGARQPPQEAAFFPSRIGDVNGGSMHRTLIIARLAILLLTSAAMAQAKAKPMDDAALDQVTAGGVTLTAGNGSFAVDLLDPNTIRFTGKVETSKGLVEAVGTIKAEAEGGGGGISISGNALQGAQSIITIIAANSKVNVLTNLVVLINPTNVTINQGNSNH